MEDRYRKLMENIRTPAGLSDRVLFEARRRAAAEQTRVRGGWGRPLLRTALCAVCAMALLLGGFSLRPAPATAGTDRGAAGGTPDAPAQVLVPVFGLTAYAAGTDMPYGPAADGSIGFIMGEGCTTPEYGDFTGCLFQVTGENIAKVKLSIDRGGLYRYQVHDHLTDEEIDAFRQAMAEGRIAPAAISMRDDGTWYMPEMTALGSTVQEDYDPEARYGFWLSPEEAAINTGLGITTEAQMDADFFDGALLRITVTSGDGTERTQVYRVHSGLLKVEFAEDNTIIVLPELADENDPCVYGIYAVPED